MGSWGGARPGAGRKPGKKNPTRRSLAARSRHRAVKLEAIADARSRALEWLRHHEDPVLDRLLSSDDDRVVLVLWQTLRAYASGSPGRSVSLAVSLGPSPAEILAEIARARDERRRSGAITAVVLPALTEGEPDAQN